MPHISESLRAGCFSTLDDESIKQIIEKMTELELNPKQVLLKQGESTGCLYVVHEGVLDVIVSLSNGSEIKVDELNSGDFAGLGSLFEKTVHSATVTAQGNVSVYRLSQNDFMALIKANPNIASEMFAYFSRSVKKQRLGFIERNPKGIGCSDKIKVAMFDSKSYDKSSFEPLNTMGFEISYYDSRLSLDTVNLAEDHQIVCVFVNDDVSTEVVKKISDIGVEMIALRCAGFNNVDLEMAAGLGISVARVPAYSPYAVAEFAVGLLLALNRKIHRAYNRIRGGDFSLSGLVGFDLHGKTIGVIGTGKIGQCFMDIMIGFGCKILCFDVYPNSEYAAKPEVTYVTLNEVYANADVISLHVPLFPTTRYMINSESIAKMKRGVVILNTSRGALIKTTDLIEGIKSGKVKGAGLDVYEGEVGYFFENKSDETITDDTLSLLLSLSNVVVSSHQAFLTEEALNAIASVTLNNIKEFSEGKKMKDMTNYVPPPVKK